jgi:arylamine N-acetyltransferase
MQQEKGLYQRFIKLLGLETRIPSLESLSELLTAHLSVIPFENISKLFYKTTLNQVHLPTFDQYLSGIEEYNFGGTCYSNNYYLFKLLTYLGYQAQLCSADMKSPGVHMVVKVSLEEKDYLLDLGYGAPFKQPIPLFLKEDFSIVSGRDQYLFKALDERGCTKLLLLRNGTVKHGYTINPGARNIGDFEQVISESFRPDSTFFNSLLVTKYISNRFCTLHNLEYTETKGMESNGFPIRDLSELIAFTEVKFRIPSSITNRVLPELNLSGDAWE